MKPFIFEHLEEVKCLLTVSWKK